MLLKSIITGCASIFLLQKGLTRRHLEFTWAFVRVLIIDRTVKVIVVLRRQIVVRITDDIDIITIDLDHEQEVEVDHVHVHDLDHDHDAMLNVDAEVPATLRL